MVNVLLLRRVAAIIGAAMVSVVVSAEELASEPAFVFLRPKTSFFWNTATNSTLTVPIAYPSGASRATLEVVGVDYRRVYDDISGKEFTFMVPAPTSPDTENVYGLTLAFNDAAATVRTARLGLVLGMSPGAEATVRCQSPSATSAWRKVHGRAVLPIPCGATSFTVDGVETDTGLGGALGWYAMRRIGAGERVALSLVADGDEYTASLVGSTGMMVIFR